MSNKAQVFTLDMILAVTVFISILLTFYWLGSYSLERIIVETEDEHVNEISQQVANLLVTQKLTSSLNQLNSLKVSDFFNSSYNETRREMGASDVGIRVRVYNISEGLLYTFGEAPESYDYLHITNRLAAYGGNPVKIRVEAWK